MKTTENIGKARLLTPKELAICIKLFRDTQQWAQEQLAEISDLSARTIQRVESGIPDPKGGNYTADAHKIHKGLYCKNENVEYESS